MFKNMKVEATLPFFGIPKMLPFLRVFKKQIITIMIGNTVFSAIEVARPLLQKYALNNFVMEGTLKGIAPFAIAFVGLLFLQALLGYFLDKTCLTTEMQLNRDLRNTAFKHLQELSFSYYNTTSIGYIQARVWSDTGKIGNLFTWQVNDTVYFGLYIVFAVVVMLTTDLKLGFLVSLMAPVVALFFLLFQGKMVFLNREIREQNSKIMASFNEGVSGAKTIKSLVAEDRIIEDFNATADKMYRKSVTMARVRGAFSGVTTMASSSALAIVLWKGGVLAAEDIGTFSLFMNYALGMMEPVRWLIDTIAIFVECQVNIERYTHLVEEVPNVTDSKDVIEKYGDCFNPKKENWEDLKGDIEFKDVDFMYPDGDTYILKNFNLKIPFGTNVAIVGETGAGKSTLSNLICRFYEPTHGQVLIDGKDSRERSQLWLHSALGYVLQTPHLFSGTVRENLLYGNKDATEEEINTALKMVAADEVVAKLENGLDSNVGEGGDTLSTGEKQLLSFARAIIAKPKIIILDEATASVDTITERKVQSAIDTVIKGRTSIVIAHRLSTIQNADIILVVDKGKIVEQGKHDELLAKKGYYSKLWMRQFEEDVANSVLTTEK